MGATSLLAIELVDLNPENAEHAREMPRDGVRIIRDREGVAAPLGLPVGRASPGVSSRQASPRFGARI